MSTGRVNGMRIQSGRAYGCTTSYSAAYEDAERRLRAGQRQVWCLSCRLWRWPDEVCCLGASRLSLRAFRAALRQVQRQHPANAVERRYLAEVRKARREGLLS